MKRNLLLGITLIGAMALSSCSVNKTATTAKNSDDVYFSNATAGEAPEYVAPKPAYQQQEDVAYNGDGNDGSDDDYYYYDDYSSRLNRFSYYSPFSYYDSYYGNYNPYNYSNYSFSLGLNWSPFTLPYGSPYGFYGGVGYGYGAFSPYAGYGWGGYYGYGGYGGYGYSPYSYWGTGYGYGGSYWGPVSAYSSYGTPRPSRGNGSPRGIGVGGRNGVGYNGTANNGIGYYPNRPTRTANGTYTTRPGSYNNNNGGYSTTRPTRQARGGNDSYQPQQRPASTARTPDRQPSYSPPSPSSSGGGGGGGGSSSGGGGGGGRPARP